MALGLTLTCYHSAHVRSCIQLIALAVQTLALIGLGIYCLETYKIRKASIDQNESQAKPCITFWAHCATAPMRYWRYMELRAISWHSLTAEVTLSRILVTALH